VLQRANDGLTEWTLVEYKGRLCLKIVLLVAVLSIGIIGIFIGASPIILLGIYGIIAIMPSMLILLNKDLFYGILAWFSLVLLGRAIGKIALPSYPDIELYRVLWILLFLVFLIQIALKKRAILPITKIEIMMIIFCIVCLVSMIKAGTIFEQDKGLVLRDFLSGYAIPFSVFFLAKHIVNSEEKIKRLFQFLFILCMYLAFTGIFEYFRLGALVFPRYIMDPNVGIHWGRARGPFVMAAVNGTVLGMIFLTSLYLVLHKQRKSSKVFYGILVSIIPITVFFTYTRTCWIGIILSMLTVSFFYPNLRKVFLFSFLIIFIIGVFNWSTTMSKDRIVGRATAMLPVYNRINLYATSLSMFLDRPIFGFGFNTSKEISNKYFHKFSGIPYIDDVAPHDTLVNVLVELGLVGLISYLLIFLYIFKHSMELYRRLPADAFLGKGLIVIFWGITIVLIVNAQFHNMVFFLFPNSLYFLLAGVIVGLNQRIYLDKNYLDPGIIR
jgi:O-antigen ligase